ncbi:class I SAM-dependent methyltransferase [Marivirga arenosa]|uniref:Class I SAM-dependent methyltransferase n=1 Tax=Marivirga arenosa TaxID=3059076 RepID=A0AA51N6I4_9BACT|nr:class I SAM-dependent methyltransferase [Marivirga sp. ABR2-2]WMN06869.1 class I SAM-dependent methyltransferase [Marivirga sp. ABR2-2]
MNFFLFKEYIKYFHLQTDEHSLHSPFFYNFYLKLIKSNQKHLDWSSIEVKRQELLNNSQEIEIFDLGAGSKVQNSSKRRISSIAKHSLSSSKFSQFLFQLIQFFDFQQIIELGTSLGINTSYLASANNQSIVDSFEADPNALKIAKYVNQNFENINFHEGNIDNTLPELLNNLTEIDLVYADANHTYEATTRYFNLIAPKLYAASIYILDDIHWSSGMNKAWNELKKHDMVSASIDLFDAGLLFFNPELNQQHYILKF